MADMEEILWRRDRWLLRVATRVSHRRWSQIEALVNRQIHNPRPRKYSFLVMMHLFLSPNFDLYEPLESFIHFDTPYCIVIHYNQVLIFDETRVVRLRDVYYPDILPVHNRSINPEPVEPEEPSTPDLSHSDTFTD